MYFDVNDDGKINLDEATQRFKELGFSPAKSSASALFFCSTFGPLTTGRATLEIDIKHIEKGKHTSSTGIFTQEGAFNPEKFKQTFALYDTNHSGSLDQDEIKNMIHHNAKNIAGEIRSTAEFGLLFRVAAGKEVVNGVAIPSLSRERLQQFYDGTLSLHGSRRNSAGNGSNSATSSAACFW